jgi:hypothetical protein
VHIFLLDVVIGHEVFTPTVRWPGGILPRDRQSRRPHLSAEEQKSFIERQKLSRPSIERSYWVPSWPSGAIIIRLLVLGATGHAGRRDRTRSAAPHNPIVHHHYRRRYSGRHTLVARRRRRMRSDIRSAMRAITGMLAKLEYRR